MNSSSARRLRLFASASTLLAGLVAAATIGLGTGSVEASTLPTASATVAATASPSGGANTAMGVTWR